MNRVRAVSWRHPHWWIAASSAAAWCWLGATWLLNRHQHGVDPFEWTAMLCAMMLPLVFGHVCFVATRSLWTRRQRAIASFVIGYIALWLLVGVALQWVTATSPVMRLMHWPWIGAVTFGAAALWQWAPLKRRALAQCHRTAPLAPRGWRADRDCLCYGSSIGVRCIVACGAMMVACAAAGHGPIAMISVSAIAGAERYSNLATARVTSLLLVVVATVYALAA